MTVSERHGSLALFGNWTSSQEADGLVRQFKLVHNIGDCAIRCAVNKRCAVFNFIPEGHMYEGGTCEIYTVH